MNTLKCILFIGVLWTISNTLAWSFPIVEWNTIWGGGNSTSFWVSTESAGGLGAGIMGLLIDNGSGATMTAEDGTIGIAHCWFPVEFGSLVDAHAWKNSTNPLANFYDIIEYGSTSLAKGVPMYLGLQLGRSDFIELEYGWAELLYDGSSISIISSATERTGLGIYAGTGTAIPESSSAGLFIIGACGLAWRWWMQKRETNRPSAKKLANLS